MRIIASLALLLISTGIARAEIVRSPTTWRVDPAPFRTDKDANTSISGAACATGTSTCLVVNDETRFAQFFTLGTGTISPGAVIGLLPKKVDGAKMKELDAEGAAYAPPRTPGAPGHFYVTGSHGASRENGVQPSRFFLLRFPVDAATGLPTFAFGAGDPPREIQPTTSLRTALARLPEIGAYAEKPLDENGLTVEGFAILDGEALFGLRAPCIGGRAFVVRAPLDPLFSREPVTARASSLAMGDNTGIRDLAAVKGGVLILTGRSNDARRGKTYSCERPVSETANDAMAGVPDAKVWLWSGKDADAPLLLGALPGVSTGMKAEGLLVLAEDASGYRILVWFDGLPDGAPLEFSVTRPPAGK
ncbi:DUF3616 domain-containing protein [Xanthobacter flavus]|uniref:DUF3616 domain-containing protein n=1 Tax=Xanthobacter flavus TaxID=281 RepID=UPI00372C3E03